MFPCLAECIYTPDNPMFWHPKYSVHHWQHSGLKLQFSDISYANKWNNAMTVELDCCYWQQGSWRNPFSEAKIHSASLWHTDNLLSQRAFETPSFFYAIINNSMCKSMKAGKSNSDRVNPIIASFVCKYIDTSLEHQLKALPWV